MSLPARQQRVINQIDGALCASEPRLAAMFAVFARLDVAPFVTRTASEQALSLPPHPEATTKDPSRVC